MTRSELVNKLAASQQLRNKDAETSVKLILDAISNHLAKGERVEIRGFGSFCLNVVPARIACNPKTGEKIEVSAKSRVYFKAGKELRERANTLAKT